MLLPYYEDSFRILSNLRARSQHNADLARGFSVGPGLVSGEHTIEESTWTKPQHVNALMSVWREYQICTLKVFVPNEGGASETLARLLGGLRDTVLCETTRTLALHKVSNIQIGPTGPRPPRPDAGGGGAPGGSKGPSNTTPRVVAILGFHDTDGMVEVINKLIVLPRRSAPHKSNAKKGKGKDTVFTTMQLNIGAGCHCTMMWMEEASTGSHGGLTS